VLGFCFWLSSSFKEVQFVDACLGVGHVSVHGGSSDVRQEKPS
jgi:hypothetical protein